MSRRWLITGCSSGLGRALSEAVLAAGHSLVATAKEPALIMDLGERYGEAVRVVALDVTDACAAQSAVKTASEAFGGLDVLVNNAGFGNVNSVEDTTLDEFRLQIETNLFGTIIMCKAAIPLMRRQRSGHIIQLSSVGGRIGAAGRAPYSAAKWGVEGFSEVLASEMALIGVKVTILEPGGFRTNFAGSSSTLEEGRLEYDAVVGAAARNQRSYNGHQPGDPALAAQVMLDLVEMAKPPFRLPLGSDASLAIEEADRARLRETLRWRRLSAFTDFPESERRDLPGDPLGRPPA